LICGLQDGIKTEHDNPTRMPGDSHLMTTVRDEVFSDVDVQIDDKSFEGCTLERCTLRYSGGPVIFQRTIFKSCKYVFYGPARATVHFLEATGLIATDPSTWTEFPEQIH
jgi:hypothetical protein